MINLSSFFKGLFLYRPLADIERQIIARETKCTYKDKVDEMMRARRLYEHKKQELEKFEISHGHILFGA